MKNRAVIYARLSREDEDKLDGNKESRSVENQIKFLTQYAFENGFELVDIYADDGYTGGNLDRPDMQRLLADIKTHRFNIVLVKDISRFGRSLHRVGSLIEKIFPENNIRVISVNDNYDSLSYDSSDSIVLRNFLNDYYLKDFKKKCKKSIDFRVRTKHLYGMGKYGYDFDEDGNEIIDKISSEVVKKIFHYVGNLGINLAQTAKMLNEQGIMTRSQYESQILGKTSFKKRQSPMWDRHSVKDIATDYEYCGHSINRVRHKKEERVLLKNTHKAIVDEDVFFKAQETIKKWRKVGRNGSYNHIANLLKYKETGQGFVYSPPRYEDKKANACYSSRGVKSSINADLLHNILFKDALSVIEKIKFNQEKMHEFYRRKILRGTDTNKFKLKTELEKVNEVYSRLIEDYFMKKIPDMIFEKKSSELQQKVKMLEKKINSCDNAIERLKIFELKLKKLIVELKEMPKNQLDIIRAVISKVYVNHITNPKEFDITIVYRFEER